MSETLTEVSRQPHFVFGLQEGVGISGVNAIEPLPIVEYSTPRSLGYNGSDLFSPEMDYQVGDGELDRDPVAERVAGESGQGSG